MLDKLDDQFGEKNYGKMCRKNYAHKLGVEFDDIIGIENLVEKGWQIWWQNLVNNLVEHL